MLKCEFSTPSHLSRLVLSSSLSLSTEFSIRSISFVCCCHLSFSASSTSVVFLILLLPLYISDRDDIMTPLGLGFYHIVCPRLHVFCQNIVYQGTRDVLSFIRIPFSLVQ